MTELAVPVNYDVLIVGGGMVGASLACALSQASGANLRIAVVENTPFVFSAQQASFDARSVALSDSSKVIFDSLDLWSEIQALGVTPIERIHVSDRGHPGSMHIDCHEQGVAALGYVVETRVLGEVLTASMNRHDNIDMICPARLETIDSGPDWVTANISRNGKTECFSAKLLVAADGAESHLRELAGIKTFKLNYGQTAVIANLACDRPHQHIAYERFTDSGPMALLPMCDPGEGEHRYALVWTLKSEQAKAITVLDEAAFLEQLQAQFGRRAGGFVKADARHSYPLTFLQARDLVHQRLVIIGNAAHSLHPVSGQGFNLGLRDVAVLAQVIVDAQRKGLDFGTREILQDYAHWRRRDQWQIAGSTDALVRIFSNDFLPLALARNIGLLALDILPPLKKYLARQAMGYIGKQSRLSRGLPL
ncbi:2-polyprenyl-6-methoxyphenol hydroxylase [hydrothermal vent metagenome]|uniref:2-polyprenyl-6-methoxyphenol hydroxylase n=1 Tax=hydrothermal vent metagenome TaxID=652676 RepID=A0A3B1BLK6_9ZZZZ